MYRAVAPSSRVLTTAGNAPVIWRSAKGSASLASTCSSPNRLSAAVTIATSPVAIPRSIPAPGLARRIGFVEYLRAKRLRDRNRLVAVAAVCNQHLDAFPRVTLARNGVEHGGKPRRFVEGRQDHGKSHRSARSFYASTRCPPRLAERSAVSMTRTTPAPKVPIRAHLRAISNCGGKVG